MRLNLYASSLILASATAMDLATSDDYAPITNTLAQVDAEAEWPANGFVASTYKRPADNCCVVYMGVDWTKVVDEPLCWGESASDGEVM